MKAPIPLELVISSFTAANSMPGSLDTYTLVISVTNAIPLNSSIEITSTSPPDSRSIRFLSTVSLTYQIGAAGLIQTPSSPTIETSRILIPTFNPSNIVAVGTTLTVTLTNNRNPI